MKYKFPGPPKSGTIKIYIKFLWIPRKCVDDYWRWLERVNVHQEASGGYWWFTYSELTHEQKFDKKLEKFIK